MLLLALLPVGAAPVRAAYQTIIDNGPLDNRVDIVFLGDGYTAADIAGGIYAAHVDALLGQMFGEDEDPFPRYRNFFNVHRVDLVSNESGTDKPLEDIFRDTALDASYSWAGGPERALYMDEDKANAVLDLEFGPVDANYLDAGFVTVNDADYGGAAGAYAVFAGGYIRAPDIALHELGHSFGQLADEYWINGTTYTGPEPLAANATKESDPTLVKWANWIGYDDPDHLEIGEIGLFEGAAYREFGLYRPSLRSKMRSISRPFDAVGREQIILNIYRVVDPVDDWEPNDAPLANPALLWVDVIDSNVIDVQWYVDGSPVVGATGETFDLAGSGYGPGTYTVTALAADNTIGNWVRRDANELRMAVEWSIVLALVPPLTGDVNADGNIDSLDITPFVHALLNTQAAFETLWPDGDYWAADADMDGNVDSLDITPFTNLILSAGTTIPEPATLFVMTAIGLPVLLRRRQRRSRNPELASGLALLAVPLITRRLRLR